MSEAKHPLTDRQLMAGTLKFSSLLVFGLLLVATIVTWFVDHGMVATGITMNALFLSVAVSFLATGVMQILHIIDWFEARQAKRNA